MMGRLDEGRLSAEWTRICGVMRAEIGEAAYQSWLKPMTVREVHGGQVRISVPTRFMRDWVVAHYADRLHELWSDADPAVRSIEVVIQPEHAVSPAAVDGGAAVAPSVAGAAAAGFTST